MGNLLLRSAFLRDLGGPRQKAQMAKAGAAAAVWAADLAVDAGLPILILADPETMAAMPSSPPAICGNAASTSILSSSAIPTRRRQDAASAARVEFVAAGGVPCKTEIPVIAPRGLVVDGLFGIGLVAPRKASRRLDRTS